MDGPCENCVFRFNELLKNPKPCNVCYDGSEYIPDDDETPKDVINWIDDPEACGAIIDIIDEITKDVECLINILPNKGIEENCSDGVGYLKCLKNSIVEYMIKGFEMSGSPCYADDCMPNPGGQVECMNCDRRIINDRPTDCPF